MWDVGELELYSCCNGELDQPIRIRVMLHNPNASDIQLGFCEASLNVILNTQRSNYERTAVEEDQRTNGFYLHRSSTRLKNVGRLRVPLAQLINNQKIEPLYADASISEENRESLDDSNQSMTTIDPFMVDITALPAPIAAPVTFQDYINSGCKLDFCVAIDFSSSNGRPSTDR